MPLPSPALPFDWSAIRLVVFDVDGTLYHQRPLRLRMLRDLAWHSLRHAELRTLNVLQAYRQGREELGEREVQHFEALLLQQTASAVGQSPAQVQAVVDRWIHQHPLPYLAACAYPGVAPLWAALRRRGVAIGVLSDYPAHAKLQALGLQADWVASANDADVAVQKPHPRGLQGLMQRAGATPASTVMVGDRADRDGAVAQRAGTHCLLRSRQPQAGFTCFAAYDDPVFAPLLAG